MREPFSTRRANVLTEGAKAPNVRRMKEHKNTCATVRAVLAAAKDKGVDPGELLKRAGIPLETAMDPDGEVTLVEMRGFWMAAYEMSRDPYLAVNAGIKAVHGSYKTLDYLLFAATKLGDGMSLFVQHFRIINTWLNFVLEQDDRGHHVILRSEIGPVPTPAVEITFTVFTERLRELLGSGWTPAEITFQHEPMGQPSFYEGFFRCPVTFGAEEARFSLSKAQWDTALPKGDEGLFRVLESHAQMLSDERPDPDDVAAQAQREILRVLSDGVPSVDVIAGALGIGSRTFQRRLTDMNMTFSQLVDDVRENQARELVRAGGMSLSEIAFFLGFSDQSAFSRAFKRWAGESPRQFQASA